MNLIEKAQKPHTPFIGDSVLLPWQYRYDKHSKFLVLWNFPGYTTLWLHEVLVKFPSFLQNGAMVSSPSTHFFGGMSFYAKQILYRCCHFWGMLHMKDAILSRDYNSLYLGAPSRKKNDCKISKKCCPNCSKEVRKEQHQPGWWLGRDHELERKGKRDAFCKQQPGW